jgi:hypothetical protein
VEETEASGGHGIGTEARRERRRHGTMSIGITILVLAGCYNWPNHKCLRVVSVLSVPPCRSRILRTLRALDYFSAYAT